MGKFGLQSKATEVCQKRSNKNTQFEWNVFLHQTAKACKEFQLKAKSTSSVEEQENQAGGEQWRWTVALSLSWWGATAKHDWNEMKIPFMKNMFKIILKANTIRHIKKNTAFQTILWSRACSGSGGAREEKWRQIEQNRSQIEANFPKSASSPGNPMNVGRNLDLANR